MQKTTYPNLDFYHVVYEAGSCGNFIVQMITALLMNKPFLTHRKGHAHHMHDGSRTFFLEPEYSATQAFKPTFSLIEPIHDEFVVFGEHTFTHINDVKKVFPRTKQIMVRLNLEQDFMLLNFFLWIKTKHHFAYPAARIFFSKDYWKDRYLNFKCYTENVETGYPTDVEDVYYINFSDIFRNPTLVMEQLCNITNKQLNEAAKTSYDNYLRANDLIRQQYYPWYQY